MFCKEIEERQYRFDSLNSLYNCRIGIGNKKIFLNSHSIVDEAMVNIKVSKTQLIDSRPQ